jgi:hypothetical protein
VQKKEKIVGCNHSSMTRPETRHYLDTNLSFLLCVI